VVAVGGLLLLGVNLTILSGSLLGLQLLGGSLGNVGLSFGFRHVDGIDVNLNLLIE